MARLFEVERITRRFYEKFKTERAAFLESIEGIGRDADREWYASLMLNRLMFLYFIQQKNFLDDDPRYLQRRLRQRDESDRRNKSGDIIRRGESNTVSQRREPDVSQRHDESNAWQRGCESQGFYRGFLLRLFHEALARESRTRALVRLLGRVPYLGGGGIFDVHALERTYTDIQIDDRAFDRIFRFFDTYQWRLDERPVATEREINPDVLGYIFEKYINQKQLGAYYTKEDITGYISRNAVIPSIFAAVENESPVAFHAAAFFDLLRQNPDRYIYEAMRRGVVRDGAIVALPPEIAAGIDDVERRAEWNRPAAEAFALPTETWREHVARRARCIELREKLAAGEIVHVNDLITHNLDIERFAADAIDNCATPDVLRAFQRALRRITILDPTCGSGAFLFAAMNVLEPLYDACLRRMQSFPDDAEFREILERVAPPTRRYFIIKSIIVSNLYGVDLMEEATEICRLRLFLKLAAQVEKDTSQPNEGLEPLSDIHFNIRHGNTLVGFVSNEEVLRATSGATPTRMSTEGEPLRLVDEAQTLTLRPDGKAQTHERLARRRETLDRRLAVEYGVDVEDAVEFEKWREVQRPFHWSVEFERIMRRGGFDVVIGNPPYVEQSRSRARYRAPAGRYRTEATGNLYALVVERSQRLAAKTTRRGSLGMIVPLSAFCTQRMRPLIELVKEMRGTKWIAHFGWRPATLFEGVNIPLAILLAQSGAARLHTTTFNKWYREYRPELFSNLEFAGADEFLRFPHVVPKIGAGIERHILKKMFSKRRSLGDYRFDTEKHSATPDRTAPATPPAATLFYRNTGGLYWRIFTDFQPFFTQNGRRMSSSTEAFVAFDCRETLALATGVLNSNLYWFFYVAFSSFHHVNAPDIYQFPIDFQEFDAQDRAQLLSATARVLEDFQRRSEIRQRVHRGGRVCHTQTFFPSLSKPLVDDIDRLLARHYGFDADELDFIINYDIKYRADATTPILPSAVASSATCVLSD